MDSPAKSSDLGDPSIVRARKTKGCMGVSACMGDSNVLIPPVLEDHVQEGMEASLSGGEFNDVEREIVDPEENIPNGGDPGMDHVGNGESPVLEPIQDSPRPSYITLRPKKGPHNIRNQKDNIPDLNEEVVDLYRVAGGRLGSAQLRRGGEKDARTWSKPWNKC
ncbi:hypothetical protein Hanom_Chr17g01587141 [Helianthus anomalus]